MAGGHKNGSEKSSNDNAAASNNLDAAKGTVALGHLVGPAIGGGIVREALKQALIRMFGAGTGAAVYELIYGEGKVDHLYHFTNDAGRAGISATGYISQSADGYVYLTPIPYESGSAAQSALATSRTPTGYFIIPANDVGPTLPPRTVIPANDQPGGGIEIRATQPVPVKNSVWRSIAQ